MRVYISGGISEVPDYTERFEKAEKYIKAAGLDPLNPAKLCKDLPKSFRHDEYMKVCLSALKCCDGIYMLNGWEKSKGAMDEFLTAVKLKMKIEFEV